jgi:hypothetical protein
MCGDEVWDPLEKNLWRKTKTPLTAPDKCAIIKAQGRGELEAS